MGFLLFLLLLLMLHVVALKESDRSEVTSGRMIGLQNGYKFNSDTTKLNKTLPDKRSKSRTGLYPDISGKFRHNVCVGAGTVLIASLLLITGIMCMEIQICRSRLTVYPKYDEPESDYGKGYDLHEILNEVYHIPIQRATTFPSSLKTYFKQRLEDRSGTNGLMKYEWARYETYKKFPLASPARPIRLASAGFYHLGNGDTVKCFCCNLEVKDWKEEDVPIDVHKRYSPQCPFLTGTDTGNVSIHDINGGASNRSMFEIDGSLSGTLAENRSNIEDSGQCTGGACNSERINKDMASLTAQFREMGFDRKDIETAFRELKTKGLRVTAESLASSLFDGNIDQTELDRQMAAAMAVSDQAYTIKSDNKDDSMTNVTKDTENVQTQEGTDECVIQQENDSIEQRISCKICLDTYSTVAFKPCGHVVSCDKCAAKLKKCAVCRKPIQARIRTFWL